MRNRRILTSGLIAFVALSAPIAVRGQVDARILGFVTQGGSVNTTDLVVRRPPLKNGAVTSAGGKYDATGSWTESGTFNGPYKYTVTVKASGNWDAGTKQMKETLVVTLANYLDQKRANGTWQFGSSATCAQDPWRFAVKCTGVKADVQMPAGAVMNDLKPAVPYPLSAAGRLFPADLQVVSLAEVIKPAASETVGNLSQVTVQVQVHPATILPATGQLRVEVRPYGSADFPTAATAKQYQNKSTTASVGGTASTLFDLSGLEVIDWQAAATYTTSVSGKRSGWVRFGGLKRVSTIAGLLNIEGESLADAASAPVSVQPMQQFGSSWSNGSQLFWGGGAVGATLTLTLDVPAAATYAVELYMTRAPDFGNVEVRLATLPPLAFSGFAPQVMSSGPIQMGKVQLAAGKQTLQFRITGKYQDSKGYKVGFDRIRLYPG